MKQSNIQIAEMDAMHVSQIAKLEQICFSDPWPDESIRSELNNPLSYWLVALDGERVIGYVGSQAVLGEADVMNVAVDPNYRRMGIAYRLIEALIAALAEKDNHSLALEVRASNTPAIALYGKMGFTEVGRRRNYYRNPREDALILRKEWGA